MAKSAVESVKYTITIEFEINGVVDKPDIVGAVFGQSEGLLGDEMDLRELQQSGKIGHILISPVIAGGKTKGNVTIPSSLTMVETCMLAAAIETVDKAGPFEAKFFTKNIEDTRQQKRQLIAQRARILLQQLQNKHVPSIQHVADEVKESARAADLIEWGPEKLAAGPEIDQHNNSDLIVVEGRADVINLLRNHIKNAIALGGSQISNSVVQLMNSKRTTVFVDGDRGGDLVVRSLAEKAKIAFVAKAPDGKEVEELERKEIIAALRHKTPYLQSSSANSMPPTKTIFGQVTSSHLPKLNAEQPIENQNDLMKKIPELKEVAVQNVSKKPSDQEKWKEELSQHLKSLKGKLKAKLVNEKNKVTCQVNIKDLIKMIGKYNKGKTKSVVLDGIVTPRLLEACEQNQVKAVMGLKKRSDATSAFVLVWTAE